MLRFIFLGFALIVFVRCGLSQAREEKLRQLKIREDIKVKETQPNLLQLEYPNGKVMYKNIGDYVVDEKENITYSPTFDSTIIDLTNIDTTLYHKKYSYWQEVPLTNFDFNHILVGDANNNGKIELYGSRKLFTTNTEPICIYEQNELGKFVFKYQYDSVSFSWNIYDVNNDGKTDFHAWGYLSDQRFFSKSDDSSFATNLKISFLPFKEQNQLNDQTLGDFDEDGNTDLVFIRFGTPSVYIYEYMPLINNFDSVYRFEINENPPYSNSGFSIGDFDLDGKADIVSGTGKGKVFVIENEEDNQYKNAWSGQVESNHAYVHTWSNDIDGNGKPEFWILADAYYNGIGTTRITIFENSGPDNYTAVGKVDLVGVFSFYAGTMQAIDIDNDSTDEVAICIDGNFLILKFDGNIHHHIYKIYYLKQNDYGRYEEYYGAILYDLNSDNTPEILISLFQDPPGPNNIRMFTRMYKADSLTAAINNVFIPSRIILYQNYPSPFNPLTNIKFELNEYSDVSIKLYNILGKEIKTLLEENLPIGEHTIQWNGKNNEGNLLPGGIYFIQMKAGAYRQTIKTILLK